MKKLELNAKAAALSGGVIWGLSLFVMTLLASSNGYADSFLSLIEGVYPYYELSVVGAFWGLLWGFLDAFIGVYIFICLYNFFVGKFK